MRSPLRREDVFRVVVSLVADELAKARKRPLAPLVWAGWTEATAIDEEGVGADSLDRLALVARVNAFFHLHEIGTEDYLVVERTLGAWTEIVLKSLEMKAERITFLTSGSTGEPQPKTHRLAHLRGEVAAHAESLGEVERVLLLVPPHHIYGFLFGALLPAFADLPVLDLRLGAPSSAAAKARPGDLVVATPHLWNFALNGQARFADGVTGLTSTAPAPPTLWDRARACGLTRFVEIYGSSDTAGVGVRERGDAPFALLPNWRSADAFDAPDDLVWLSDRTFAVRGRKDGAVQVAGVNVFPGRVAEVLETDPEVLTCAVRRDGDGPEARLKAFVVLRPGHCAERAEERLLRLCAERLSPPERPARFAFGADLPRSETGKLIDWP